MSFACSCPVPNCPIHVLSLLDRKPAMTYLEQAIKDAVEKGGYDIENIRFNGQLMYPDALSSRGEKPVSALLLDPAFWQALGRARGWDESKFYSYDGVHATGKNMPEAQWYHLSFIQHLWKDGTTEEFFKSFN